MASGGVQLCDICSLRHSSVEAIEWCPECDEYLCEKCKEHHALAKLTRKHGTVLLGNIQKLPCFVKDIKINCSEHEERYLYFCNDHEFPCCVECVKIDHEHCRNLSPIQKVVQDCKFSTSFSDLEKTVSDILENYENIISDRMDFLQSLDDQKISLLQSVKSTREALNNYLDKLEIELTEKIEQSISEKNNEAQSLLKDMGSRKDKAVVFKENIEAIKNYATDFQSFMAMRHLSESVLKEESVLQQMFEGDVLDWLQITLTPTQIQSISNSFCSLGEVGIERNPCKVNLVAWKCKQAQLFESFNSVRKVQNIHLRNQSQFRIIDKYEGKNYEVLDCLILPNGKLVFSDKANKRLVIYGANYSFEKEILLIFHPVRFTALDSSSVAVTTGHAQQIQIINLESGIVTKTLDTRGIVCCSIFKINTGLVVENFKMGYVVLKFDGTSLTNIEVDLTAASFHALAVIRNLLYYVDSVENKVYCCDLKGNQLWEFKNKGLKCPYGLTSDNSSVIFVAGFHSKNVFAISSDGKHFSEIISSNQLLNSPVAMFYCVKSKKLLITEKDGHVFLYDDI